MNRKKRDSREELLCETLLPHETIAITAKIHYLEEKEPIMMEIKRFDIFFEASILYRSNIKLGPIDIRLIQSISSTPPSAFLNPSGPSYGCQLPSLGELTFTQTVLFTTSVISPHID